MRDLVILLIDETGLAVAIPIVPIGSWLGQTPIPNTNVCTHRRSQNYTTTASQSTHGGCRGTVVGAVVEIEQADEAEVRGGGMRIQEFASSKDNDLSGGEKRR